MARLASVLVERSYKPDYILCSPAQRTRETLQLILPENDQRDYPEVLYNASVGTLHEKASHIEDGYSCLLIVAHNPGVDGLVRFLSTPESLQSSGQAGLGYPPGSLAVIDAPCESWKNLAAQENNLRDFLIPGQDF